MSNKLYINLKIIQNLIKGMMVMGDGAGNIHQRGHGSKGSEARGKRGD